MTKFDDDAKSRWLERLRRNPAVSGAAFRLAHAIAQITDAKGQVLIRRPSLFAMSGMPKSTARNALSALRIGGWIEIDPIFSSDPLLIQVTSVRKRTVAAKVA